MINSIAWVLLGGLLGLVASMTLNRGTQRHALINVAIGSVGALFIGGLLALLFGITNVNQTNFSLAALAGAVIGAVILLILFNFWAQFTSTGGLWPQR